MNRLEPTQLATRFLPIAAEEPACGSIDPEIFFLAYAGVALAAPVYLGTFFIAVGPGFGPACIAQGSFHHSIYVPYIGTKNVKIKPQKQALTINKSSYTCKEN